MNFLDDYNIIYGCLFYSMDEFMVRRWYNVVDMIMLVERLILL